MSGLLTEIGSILFGPNRSIAGIIPDVTIRETGLDESVLTEHPIEATGSGPTAINDHVYKRPPNVTLEYGWSNSALSQYSATDALNGIAPDFSLGTQRVMQVYEQLLALQNSRTPFQIVTGKRLYQNMVMVSLAQTTDAKSENALMVVATCRQANIVSTTTTTVQAPMANQAMPATTAGVVDMGQVQPVPVTNPPQSLVRLFNTPQ